MWTKNCIILLAFLVACGAYEVPETVKALGWHTLDFQQLPTPADLAFGLSEDEFEDYLNFWLQKKMESSQENTIFQKEIGSRAPCTVKVNSLSYPQPVYVSNGVLLTPSDNTGNINFADGQVVTMACPGSNLVQATLIGPEEADLMCIRDSLFSNPWLPGVSLDFNSMNCGPPSVSTENDTRDGCLVGTSSGTIITVGLETYRQTHTIITSCVDVNNANVLYAEYDQAYNAVRAPAARPRRFKQGPFFPDNLSLTTVYKQEQQKIAFDWLLGPGSGDHYLTTNFLTRGHLAAKADFVFSPAQRATFTYANVAPQWKEFNEGNWATLEEDLRNSIAAGKYLPRMRSGTIGNLQLYDVNGSERNIYLSYQDGRVPVPLWFYKTVRETLTGIYVTFLGLNNPYATLAEVKTAARELCIDLCDGADNFSWLKWDKKNVTKGYSMCCYFDDLRKTVTSLPAFTAGDGLFF